MHPVGVSIIAILKWIRGSIYAFIGLVLRVVGHVSDRLVSTMASDSSFLETLFSRVGKAPVFGALLIAVAYIAVGLGWWQPKNWERAVTIVLVGMWLFLGLIGMFRFPTLGHVVRVLMERSLLYLMLAEVKKLFVPTKA